MSFPISNKHIFLKDCSNNTCIRANKIEISILFAIKIFTICYKVDYGIYFSEYTAERIQEFFVEKPIEQEVVNTDKSNLQIFAETYQGLEVLEKMGYSLDDMTCGELKKLLYKKIVG